MPPKRPKQYSRTSRARKPSAITGTLDLVPDDIAISPETSGRNVSKSRSQDQNQKRTGDPFNLDVTMDDLWSDPPVLERSPRPKEPPDTFQDDLPDTFQNDLGDFEIELRTSSPHTLLERSLLSNPGTAATSAYSQRTVAVMGDDFLSDIDLPHDDDPPRNGDSSHEGPPLHRGDSPQTAHPPLQPTTLSSKPKKAKQMAKVPFSQATASQAPPPPSTKNPASKSAKAPAKPPAKSSAKAAAKPPAKSSAKAPAKSSAKASAKPPAKKLKRHQQMQTYDKTPSPLTEPDKSSGSTARKKRKQPTRPQVMVVPDDEPPPVQEKPQTELLNEHSLRKPQVISFSPNGPLNLGRRSPQKRQLEAASSSREAKRPRTKASTTTKKVISPPKQQPAAHDDLESADADDDMGMPADSYDDSSDFVPEPTKQRAPVEQLASRETGQSATAAQVATVASHFAEALQHKEITMPKSSYRPPVRRSSRVDETGSPSATVVDVSMTGMADKPITVQRNEELGITERHAKSQRQPPPEFRIDLTQSTPPPPKSAEPVSLKSVSSTGGCRSTPPAAREALPKMKYRDASPKPVEPVSQKPTSDAGAGISSRVPQREEREALPKLNYRPAPPKPTEPASQKPTSNTGAGRSSHAIDREALPTLACRPPCHQNTQPGPAVVEKATRNVQQEPVAANIVPQVSSKFLQGFKQALLPAHQDSKLEQETRQGQPEYANRAQFLGMQDVRNRELHVPTAEKFGQAGPARQPRDQYRQGRLPEVCESNLHVVVPAIIEIFLEKLRHKEGVVEKVAKLYAGNGNKLVQELRGSHYKDQRVLAQTYNHRREEFVKKCKSTMQKVQSIQDAMDGCGVGVASPPDMRRAAVEQAMAKLREARAQRPIDGQAV